MYVQGICGLVKKVRTFNFFNFMVCEYYLFSQIMRKSGGSCQPAGVAARVNLGDRSGDRSGDLKTPTTFD